MPEQRQEPIEALRSLSDELLAALEEVREVERQKRMHPVSTPMFHLLADQILARSRDIFRLTAEQWAIGEDTPTGDRAIADVEGNEGS
jgi:hypothetical protein